MPAFSCTGAPDCGDGSENYNGAGANGPTTITSGGSYPGGQCGQGEEYGVSQVVDEIPRNADAFRGGTWSFSPGFNVLNWTVGMKIRYLKQDGTCTLYGGDNEHWLVASASKGGPSSGAMNVPPDAVAIIGVAAWSSGLKVPYACNPWGASMFTLNLVSAPGIGILGGTGVRVECPGPNIATSSFTTCPGTTGPGATVTHTLTIVNSGTLPAANVTIAVTNPNLTDISVVPTSIATIAAGASATVTVTGKVATGYTGNLTTTAVINADGGKRKEVTCQFNSVAAPDFTTSTKVGPARVRAGSTITYTVTALNTGAAEAIDVSVSDTNPSLTGVSVLPAVIASILPGASGIFTITATVLSTVECDMNNTVTITYTSV